MDDLRDRFSAFDQVGAPDLTTEIRRRIPSTPRPAQQPGRRRVLTMVLALLLAVAAVAVVVRAFRPLSRTPLPADSQARGWITAAVQDIGITWPASWTLVQLGGEDGGSQPILQLTNYDVDLAGKLCPEGLDVPPDGVSLYLQRNVAGEPSAEAPWPVSPDLARTSVGTCGRGTHVGWRFGGEAYEGLLVAGPEASDADRRRLLAAFKSLDFEDFRGGIDWHPESVPDGERRLIYEGPKYVAWGIPVYAMTGRTLLIVPDLEGRWGGPLRVFVDGGLHAIAPDDAALSGKPHFQFGGDIRPAGETTVRAYGYVSLDTRRLVIEAGDGRVIEAMIGPSLERYGLPLKPIYAEFESPLLGRWVAFDAAGNRLGSERYDNWPPDQPAERPEPSLPPSEGRRYRVPDEEAEAYRDEVYAAVRGGTILLEGDNWNFPWVVYVDDGGRVLYRDGESSGPVGRPDPHVGGTRYNWRGDPEILFVGQLSREVAWFGVERANGDRIAATIALVPGTELQVADVTVRTPRDGDRLAARDAAGRILQLLPLKLDR